HVAQRPALPRPGLGVPASDACFHDGGQDGQRLHPAHLVRAAPGRRRWSSLAVQPGGVLLVGRLPLGQAPAAPEAAPRGALTRPRLHRHHRIHGPDQGDGAAHHPAPALAYPQRRGHGRHRGQGRRMTGSRAKRLSAALLALAVTVVAPLVWAGTARSAAAAAAPGTAGPTSPGTADPAVVAPNAGAGAPSPTTGRDVVILQQHIDL